MLGETNETLGKFKAALKQNGAEFPVSEFLLQSEELKCCLNNNPI
jgi:hypothetical protein